MSEEDRKPRRIALNPRQWAAAALVVVALVFILQNLTYVRVEFFLIHTAAPLWLVLLVTLAAGYAIGWFSKRRG
ncbi:LapA family protein [Glutamicibacter halophytocola]|uniref:LapA family protein n=1 Tax=Glutamicibacter halophytocola TaxID=1933880 RepID=UPI001558E9E2|nr:LapA family protein [Glutamicibacter halophytocola]NQD40746.1 LapA family protein [Glutamicibacter halophytocola]